MADQTPPVLVFPQLTSGAIAQYPIAKTRNVRTVRNVLADGRLILLPDPGAATTTWTLSYVELTADDVSTLRDFFASCSGGLRAFTFPDPTQNLLQSASDLTASAWTRPAGINVRSGLPGRTVNQPALTLTNTSQGTLEISQSLPLPAYYHYCFSAWVRSSAAESISLFRRSASTQDLKTFSLSSDWTRIVLSGSLDDRSSQLTVGVSLPAGKSFDVCGIQFEAQLQPSENLFSSPAGGVYVAHWAQQEFITQADGPDSFSTTIKIQANV